MDASSKACKSKCDRTHYYSLGSVVKDVIWSERRKAEGSLEGGWVDRAGDDEEDRRGRAEIQI